MNEMVHPKRLRLFMEKIREECPETVNVENYRFYYLFTDYGGYQEYLFSIVSQHAIDREGKKLNNVLDTWSKVLNFTNATIMTEDDFQRVIEVQLNDLQKTVRGTKYTTLFYEIW